MGEPLKRTFHGCLTCRKRKVRCRGGNPCQNCARMNITCHSSFETNLRVSVAYPNGRTEFSSAVPRQPRNPSSSSQAPFQQHHGVTQFVGTQAGPAAPVSSLSSSLATPEAAFVPPLASQPSLFNGFPGPLPTYVAPQPAFDLPVDQLLLSDVSASPNLLCQFGLDDGWDFDFTFQSFAPAYPIPEPPQPIGASFERFQFFDSSNNQVSGTTVPATSCGYYAAGSSFHAPVRATEEWTPRRRKVRSQPDGHMPSSGQERNKQSSKTAFPGTSSPNRYNTNSAIKPVNSEGPSPAEDTFYLQYYRDSVRDALAGKADGQWCYHRFISRHLQDVPPKNALRLAVLAWTAKQYSATPGASPAAAVAWRSYYRQADLELTKLFALDDWSTLLPCLGNNSTANGAVRTVGDLQILVSLFMCRCDTLNNDRAALLRHLSDLSRELQRQMFDLGISAFASRVLIWLAYLHVRIRIFAPAPNSIIPSTDFGLDEPVGIPQTSDNRDETLLDTLINRDDGASIIQRSHSYLAEVFGSAYPAAQIADDATDIPIFARLHEIFCLLSNMLRLRSSSLESSSPGSSPSSTGVSPASSSSTPTDLRRAKVRAIEADLARLEAQFNLAKHTVPAARVLALDLDSLSASTPVTAGTSRTESPSTRTPTNEGSTISPSSATANSYALTRAETNWLTGYAAYLAVKALWSRQQHPSRRSDPDSANAVRQIICIAIRLRKSCTPPDANKSRSEDSSRKPAPTIPPGVAQSMLWRLPIFVAGIETSDDVYADWIRAYLQEMEGERMGARERTEANWREEPCRAKAKNANGDGDDEPGDKMGKKMTILSLMERVRELQDVKGQRVDVGSVVAEMEGDTGAFIV